jgi:hypothetical protein
MLNASTIEVSGKLALSAGYGSAIIASHRAQSKKGGRFAFQIS